MTETELKQWEKGLYQGLNSKWKDWGKENEYIQKNGFALFYSPVVPNPDLMIIGLNPGTDDDPFNPVKEAPDYHDYFEFEGQKADYKMAKQMRKLFKEDLAGKLQKSVKLNRLFFRSHNYATWKKNVDKELLVNIENYCLGIVKNIIEELKPKIILCEGLDDPFYKLVSMYLETEDVYEIGVISNRKRRLMQHFKRENITILSIPHPSGSKGLTNEVMDSITALLRTELKERKQMSLKKVQNQNQGKSLLWLHQQLIRFIRFR